jgi:hypothetical protein
VLAFEEITDGEASTPQRKRFPRKAEAA